MKKLKEIFSFLSINLFLKIKKDAGQGIFLSCKNQKFLLPGTLLGFYPGVVFSKNIPPPELEVNSYIPYLKRYDGTWLDPNYKIPLPFDHTFSLQEWFEKENDALKVFKYNIISYK